MAVLLREKIKIDGSETIVRVFHPSGVLSKKDRDLAMKLDEYLAENIPQLAAKFLKRKNVESKSPLYKWHQFGKALRKIFDKPFVSPVDIENGYIWSAIRQHLPEDFPLKNAGQAHDKDTPLHQNREHFAVCYAFGNYEWEDVKWLHRWDDWCQIYYRMGIGRDIRILHSLGSEINSLDEYPTKKQYRKIISNMAGKFPQHSGRRVHSDVLDDRTIEEWVREAVKAA